MEVLNMSKMFVKTGDTVVVLSGKSKGVKGDRKSTRLNSSHA